MAEASTRIGTEVLFENDHLRVWDFRLSPGEESELHTHRYDYLMVYTTDSDLEVEVLDDVEGKRLLRSSYGDGFVQYNIVGTIPSSIMTHRLRNVGTEPHRQILIEFLRSSDSQKTQDPQTNERGISFTQLVSEANPD